MCERIPSVTTDGFSTQRIGNTLRISMSWRHVNDTTARSCSRVSYMGEDLTIYIIESEAPLAAHAQMVIDPVKSRFARQINCYSTPKWSIMWYNSNCSTVARSWTSVELSYYYYIMLRIQCGLLPYSRNNTTQSTVCTMDTFVGCNNSPCDCLCKQFNSGHGCPELNCLHKQSYQPFCVI